METFADADVQFHGMLYTLSGHKRIGDIWSQYEPMLATLLRTSVISEEDLDETTGKHQLLYQLLRSGDHDAARNELHDHLENSHRRMLRAHRAAGAVDGS